jgi:hypothetical protein
MRFGPSSPVQVPVIFVGNGCDTGHDGTEIFGREAADRPSGKRKPARVFSNV